MHRLIFWTIALSPVLFYTSCCTQGARSADVFVAVKGNQSQSQVEIQVDGRSLKGGLTEYFGDSTYHKFYTYNYNICKDDGFPKLTVTRQSTDLLRVVCAENDPIYVGSSMNLLEIIQAEAEGQFVPISSDSAFKYLKATGSPYYFELLPNESTQSVNMHIPLE